MYHRVNTEAFPPPVYFLSPAALLETVLLVLAYLCRSFLKRKKRFYIFNNINVFFFYLVVCPVPGHLDLVPAALSSLPVTGASASRQHAATADTGLPVIVGLTAPGQAEIGFKQRDESLKPGISLMDSRMQFQELPTGDYVTSIDPRTQLHWSTTIKVHGQCK